MSPSQEKSIEENLAKTIKLLGTNNLLPINIFIVANDGSILWVNDRLLQEIKVKTLHSILHKNVNIFGEIFANGIERVIAKKREEIVEERYKENYYITCRYPVIASDNVVQYIIGISLNITKIKQAELAKQEFLQNMAHDIRTPLAGIIGLAQLQQMGLKSLAESKEYGEMIYGTGNQLLELLNAIIEVIDTEQMMDPLKKEPLDLSGLARELHALMEPAIYTKGLYFNLALDEDLPVILSDKTKLKRVLINILSNAVKFTKEGKINFSIKLLNIENSLAEIEIKIVDTGIGIAKENLDKIFDRFYRAHPTYLAEYSGYGLGLALAKEALDLLGGKIKVASEEGKGSCFTLQFTFPLANKNYDKIENISVVSQKVRVKADPVLIAEDNVIVLRVIKQFLEQAGYAVLPTIDGKAALEALKINSVSWALLDIGLPELNGVEVCKQYRKWEKENSRPYLPIFALTGHSIKEVERKCHEAGIDKVFVKPLNNKMIQAMESFVHFIQQKIS